VLGVHLPDHLAEAATEKLEGDVARAHEGAHAPAQENLDAPRRAKHDRPVSQRLTELAGRHDERQHAEPADGSEPRLVRDAEARRAREALEVDRARVADARSRDEEAVREELGRHGARRVLREGRLGHAGRVVGDGDLHARPPEPREERVGVGAPRRPREDDLVDLDLDRLARALTGAPGAALTFGSACQDLLSHGAGGIPGSCAHDAWSSS
jgi:hypothetical protein